MIFRDVTGGLIAGAAGTVALNTLTYLDMAVRGRPASSMPAQTVNELTGRVGVELAADDDAQTGSNRSEGWGALLGYLTGLGFGAAYGVIAGRRDDVPVSVGAAALTLGAMTGANVPAVATGLTDPREWGAEGWLMDVVPHAVYGLVTAAVYDRIH